MIWQLVLIALADSMSQTITPIVIRALKDMFFNIGMLAIKAYFWLEYPNPKLQITRVVLYVIHWRDKGGQFFWTIERFSVSCFLQNYSKVW